MLDTYIYAHIHLSNSEMLGSFCYSFALFIQCVNMYVSVHLSVYLSVFMSACIYVFVCMRLLESAFCFIHSICMQIYVCMNFLFPFLFCWPHGVKRVQRFSLGTGSASPSKLCFVPSARSLLSNFSPHWLL